MSLKIETHKPGLHRWPLALIRPRQTLSQVARAAASERHEAKRRASELSGAIIEWIRLIEAQPQRPWTLEHFAAAVDLSPSYLLRLFTRSTGVPPLKYLARWRLERAATLLVRSELAISDVAFEVGWNDPNLFARRFRNHFGISALEYRYRVRISDLTPEMSAIEEHG